MIWNVPQTTAKLMTSGCHRPQPNSWSLGATDHRQPHDLWVPQTTDNLMTSGCHSSLDHIYCGTISRWNLASESHYVAVLLLLLLSSLCLFFFFFGGGVLVPIANVSKKEKEKKRVITKSQSFCLVEGSTVKLLKQRSYFSASTASFETLIKSERWEENYLSWANPRKRLSCNICVFPCH